MRRLLHTISVGSAKRLALFLLVTDELSDLVHTKTAVSTCILLVRKVYNYCHAAAISK